MAAVALVSFLFLFQNCLTGNTSDSPSLAATQPPSAPPVPSQLPGSNMNGGGGNGDAYDKPVFVIISASGYCPDGSPLQSEIDIVGRDAILVRDDCRAIPVALQQKVTIAVDPNNKSIIVYNGQQYYEVDWFLWGLSQDSRQNMYVIGLGSANHAILNLPPNFTAISKFDSAGKMVWSRFVPLNWVYEIQLRGLANGNLALITQTQQSDFSAWGQPNTAPSSIHVMDPSGAPLWSASYIDTAIYSNYQFKGIFAFDSDALSNLYVVGGHKSNDGTSDLYFLMKLDPNGIVLWQKGLPDGVLANNVQVSPQGRIFVSGKMTTSANGIVMQFTPAGDVVKSWAFQAPNSTIGDGVGSLAFAPSGNLIVSGTASALYSTTGDFGGWVASVAADGGVQWANSYLDSSGKANYSQVFAAPDGTIYLNQNLAKNASGQYIGLLTHVSAGGQPLSEIVFSGPLAPSALDVTSLVFNTVSGSRQLWSIGYVTQSEGTFNASRWGMVKMDPTQANPCTFCATTTVMPVARPVSLTIGDGPTALQPLTFSLTTATLLPFAQSPLPIPVY